MAARRVNKSNGGKYTNTELKENSLSLQQIQKQQQSKAKSQASVKENYIESVENSETPYVQIVEQPACRMVRFRYECEGRTASAIPGVNSTPLNKSFPTIEIVGYNGASVIVVSCVSKDAPYRPHPYNLIGKEGCRSGVCTIFAKAGTSQIAFNSLGVQCVKRTGVEASLKIRQDIRVDPFKTGFAHATEPIFVDMTAIRLCFQVFIEDSRGRFTVPLKPIVSDPVYDSRAVAELKIFQMCSSSTVLGDKQIILLCEKIYRERTMVRFYEEKNGEIIWQSFGGYQPSDVHRQTAIKLYPPQYHNLDITEPVEVFVQLVNVIEGTTSEPWPFKYLPIDSDEVLLKRKCKRIGLGIATDPKKEQASSGDCFREIMKSWGLSDKSKLPSTQAKEGKKIEILSSDDSSESGGSRIPEVLSDITYAKMDNSEDSNDSMANHKLQPAVHQLSAKPPFNYKQQQALFIKAEQHTFPSSLSLPQQPRLIESTQPESLQLQQQHLEQSPQHQSFTTESPLPFDSPKLQIPEHTAMKSHELNQQRNFPMPTSQQYHLKEAHELQKHQPLVSYQKQYVELTSPHLQHHHYEQSPQLQNFPTKLHGLRQEQQHFLVNTAQPPALRIDSPQLQHPEHLSMESREQQQNFSMPSPPQHPIEASELKQQNQFISSSYQQQSQQQQQHLVKHSPLHQNSPIQSHLQIDSSQLQQQYPHGQSPHYQHIPMESPELKQHPNFPILTPPPLELIEIQQQSEPMLLPQQQQALHMNTFQLEQDLSGKLQQQCLSMNSSQLQQQNVLLSNPKQPLDIPPQQLQQLQSLMAMSTQLQQQQPHSAQQQILQQYQNNTGRPSQEGMLATVLANAFASLMDNYQAKFQQLIAATANTMLQSAQWNNPSTDNTVNPIAPDQQQQQQEITQQQQQLLIEQQPHQNLTRTQIQQRRTNNTSAEGTVNTDQSNDHEVSEIHEQDHAINNLLNLENEVIPNADSDLTLSSPLWDL